MVSKLRKSRKRKQESYCQKKESENNTEVEVSLSPDTKTRKEQILIENSSHEKSKTYYLKNKELILKKKRLAYLKNKNRREDAKNERCRKDQKQKNMVVRGKMKKNWETYKIAAREKYKLEPEKKKLSERTKYRKDPEKKKLVERMKYRKNPENKKLLERMKYRKNPENKKLLERINYRKNPENKKLVEKMKYERDPEHKKLMERLKYQKEPENKKLVERLKYQKEPESKKLLERLKYQKEPESKKLLERLKYQKEPENKKLLERLKYQKEPENKKLLERLKYQKEPENKKLLERLKYQKEPENKKLLERLKYQKEPENKKLLERLKYQKEPENKKLLERLKYQKDPVNKRLVERMKYQKDPVNKRLVERMKYQKDPVNKRLVERMKYQKDPVNKRLVERIKYRKDPSKKKNAMNILYKTNTVLVKERRKMYYTYRQLDKEKKLTQNVKFNYRLKKLQWAKEILFAKPNKSKIERAKYGSQISHFRDTRKNKHFFNLKWINTDILAKKIVNKIKSESLAKRLLQSKQLIKWSLYAHKIHKKEYCKKFSTFRSELASTLKKVESVNDASMKVKLICGDSLHTSSTEPFLHEFSYRTFSNKNKRIIIDDQNVASNIFSTVSRGRAEKSQIAWKCSEDVCNINANDIHQKIEPLLRKVSTLSHSNGAAFIQQLNECTNPSWSMTKQHSLDCYITGKCISCLPYFRALGPHFPKIRKYVRTMYDLIKSTKQMLAITKAIQNTDVEYLKEITKIAQKKGSVYLNEEALHPQISESEILLRYPKAFLALEEKNLDLAIHPCVSCEKLYSKSQIRSLSKLRKSIESVWWSELSKLKPVEVKRGEICHGCLEKFRQGHLPATCILNDLYTSNLPDEIKNLNQFEKLLIQRAKAFQVVTRMGTVAMRHVPAYKKIQKVKGSTFYLPLPLQETLKKLPDKRDPINLNTEFYVLVRGVPTANKIIWESLVDINKVYDALHYLKLNNELYKDVVLPDNPNTLLEIVNNEKGKVHYSPPLSSDDKPVAVRKALLTQVSSKDWDIESAQYTIHALHAPKLNETACGLYKMLRVTEEPIDPREKKIDLLCFPDLFPFGKFGQFHERRVKLNSSEFIKSRLLSKHSRYRLNQQYLFYLLHDANIRQLRQGIFHKMNVTPFEGRLTAGKCLKMLENSNLESELTTIFAKLRNTPQYWVQPRNDIQCMTANYGPATWFLTMSPSEWNWDDLGSYISRVNPILEKFENKSTSELLALDPVSTSRFIDIKFQGMLQFLKSKDNPLGPVTHYFYRREYQSRGLQHFHLMLWIDNAPILGESSNQDVIEFISKYITCEVPNSDISPTLYDRVTKYQTHVHNSYCLRNKKIGKDTFRKVCRFAFPRPVTDELILRDAVHAVAGRKALKKNSRLYELPRGTNEQYINDYNPVVLMAWDGNIDLQFVGENTNMLNWYVTKYTTKSEGSHLGDMFRDINSTKSLHSRLFNIGIRSLNHRECGALEASDTLLSIPLYGTDPDTTIRWLDVNMVRKKRLQPINKIKDLEEESTNIYFESWVDDYYPNRPKILENTTLYDFVRWFDVRKNPLKGDQESYQMNNKKYLVKRLRPYLINHYKYNLNQRPENYYHALLLMFKPWRDSAELKSEFETYMESFNFHKEKLIQAVEYDIKLKEIENVIEHTKDLIQIKISEYEKENAGTDTIPQIVQQHPNNHAEVMIQDMTEINLINEYNIDLSIDDVYKKLNDDQKRVFDDVTKKMANHDGQEQIVRHFVSGVGGTGKSYLINAIRIWTKQKHGTLTAVSAPTGLSAYNINGLTIYKLFQLPVEHGHTPKFRSLSDDVLKAMRTEMQNVSLFIIDEISMVSNLTLIYIHLRLSEVFATSDIDNGWFGKKHILLFGDLLQLPPVHEDFPFEDISQENLKKYIGALSVINLWQELFTYDELSINMRQAGDMRYAEILSRIRVGHISAKDIAILNKRLIPMISNKSNERIKEIGNYLSDLPFDTVCLCATGRLCCLLNKEMLSRLDGEDIFLVAKDSVECNPGMRGKLEKLLRNHESDSTRTAGMEKTIAVKVGAKVMLRRNINVAIGLVNSAMGIVTGIKRNIDVPSEIEKVTVRFNSGIKFDLERVSSKFEVMAKAYVYRSQFPLSISYGITIHKSQGLSLNTVLMDIGETIFTCGQAYVALSRVKSLEGLHLINFSPANVKASSTAITEYNRLRLSYRTDMPLLPTSDATSKKRPPRIRDKKWAPHKQIGEVHGEPTKKEKIVYSHQIDITGFRNPGNFCYANAVIQCLYSSLVVRNTIVNESTVPFVLKNHLKSYGSKVLGLETKELRDFIGGIFAGPDQQDCVEFLEAALNAIHPLRNIAIFTQISTTLCKQCGHSNAVTAEETVLRLAIPSRQTSLKEMFEKQFGHWCNTDEGFRCSLCNATGQAKQKYEILSASNIVAVQLLIFDNLQLKKATKLAGIPKTKLLIGGKHYSPIAGIFHYGPYITEGHYKAMLKREGKWICADDEKIGECRWPLNAKDLYVLFLGELPSH